MTDRGDRISDYWKGHEGHPGMPPPIMAAPGQPGSPLQDNSKFTFSNLPINPGVIEEIRALCIDKGWRENVPEGMLREPYEQVPERYTEYIFAAYIALAHSELTEALEAFRDKIWSNTREPVTFDEGPSSPAKPIGVGPELADVIIRVLDMCDIWKIDINHEIQRVLQYGWTRPYKHGGRDL